MSNSQDDATRDWYNEMFKSEIEVVRTVEEKKTVLQADTKAIKAKVKEQSRQERKRRQEARRRRKSGSDIGSPPVNISPISGSNSNNNTPNGQMATPTLNAPGSAESLTSREGLTQDFLDQFENYDSQSSPESGRDSAGLNVISKFVYIFVLHA